MPNTKKTLDEICHESIQISLRDSSMMPWWMKAVGIHPDDRSMPGDSPADQYLNGARYLIITTDNQEVVAIREECIERIKKYLDKETLDRWIRGDFDKSDLDRYAQIGLFGEIRYHKGDKEAPRGAEDPASAGHTHQ